MLPTLRYGDAGTNVELMQLALCRAGFTLKKDGVFGTATLSALRRFQTAKKLTPDGIAGRLTWQSLTPYLLGYDTHTVRRGDTLYRLAALYGTTVHAIETANPDADALNLKIGSRLVIPYSFDVVPTDVRFTPTVYSFAAAGLRARYPFITEDSAGKSVMGYPLRFFKIGDGAKEIFYNAAHHANEWITAPLLMKFLENYAHSFAYGEKIGDFDAKSLYSGASLYMMPMVNPDGVSLVTGELVSGGYYDSAAAIAMDYPAIPFPDGWKANIAGIDTNLQYPAGWDEARKIKFAQGFTSPAPRDYVGSAPLTAPESRAAYDFTLSRDFALTISFHTQGEVIYWRYLDYEPDGAYEIAVRFAAASGYAVEDVPAASGYAGYKDWFIMRYDRPGYTIEVGRGTAPLPLEQFDKIYRDNLGILTLGLAI